MQFIGCSRIYRHGIHCGYSIDNLLRATRDDQCGGNALLTEHPSDGHLRKDLTACDCNLVVCFDLREMLLHTIFL